jgi:deazaflavin-dependent oxidoreductase (nitroreductase family)
LNQPASAFQEPSPGERLFNKTFGILVGLGLGLRHNYLLQVRGRKTGRVYSTPVNVLELNGKWYLVGARGQTQWVRNAGAAGAITLKKGWGSKKFRVRFVPNDEKPAILAAYLNRFRLTVQRYFPVPAGSEPKAFVDVADRFPVVELIATASAA